MLTIILQVVTLLLLAFVLYAWFAERAEIGISDSERAQTKVGVYKDGTITWSQIRLDPKPEILEDILPEYIPVPVKQLSTIIPEY